MREVVGAERAISMAPVWYADVFEVNPETSSVWSLAALNDMDTILNRVE